MVILFFGNSKPEFFIADFTLSVDSLTAVSASPTSIIFGIPLERSTSTSTG